jgi:hypothetical protein
VKYSRLIYWAAFFVIARSAATKQSHEGYEIATHLSDARNDNGKQLDESSNYKNLEVKFEDNT